MAADIELSLVVLVTCLKAFWLKESDGICEFSSREICIYKSTIANQESHHSSIHFAAEPHLIVQILAVARFRKFWRCTNMRLQEEYLKKRYKSACIRIWIRLKGTCQNIWTKEGGQSYSIHWLCHKLSLWSRFSVTSWWWPIPSPRKGRHGQSYGGYPNIIILRCCL